MNGHCHPDCTCHAGRSRADVSFVTLRLAVGGMVHDFEIEELRGLGITRIINVNWPDRPEYLAVIGAFDHLDLPILDDAEPKPPEWFAAGVGFAAGMGPSDRLLVHCGHGINRSPAMAYAILRSWGMDAESAEGALRTARPQTGGGTFEVYRQSAEDYLAAVAR